MYVPRIYQDVPLQAGLSIKLTREAANHLMRVLRLQINDQFILFNGNGGEFSARITTITKNDVIASIEEFNAKSVESPLNLHLGQGISRGEKMDFVIQKAVELGVQRITPLITMKCGVKLSAERWDKRLQHWRAIAIAACEQSGRNQIPEIVAPLSLAEWLSDLNSDLKLVCQPGAVASLKNYTEKYNKIALLIGPESGLDDKEFLLAQQQGFNPVHLGPRVLRTETAPIAAVTAIQVYFGDMS